MHQNRREAAFINQVNKLIASNLKDERFGVSELADKMIMSRKTLYRKIKSSTGESVSLYIRNARLNKALELLKKESVTVSEAAYMTGFGSATYFSKCFRDYFGYPPVEIINQVVEGTDLNDDKEFDASNEITSRMHNFPVRTTTFIGRENEIKSILDLVQLRRILTLTGAGGCGKTRLACEVAVQLVDEYPDGIWFVDLAPVKTVDLVTRQLMNTLGFPEEPGKEIIQSMEEGIRDKKLLILLDNCEHLLITCAEITRRLIQSVPGLSIIATSREALNIEGEQLWRIPSLSLVDPSTVNDFKQILNSEAVRLFMDRARLNNPGFELVEQNASTVLSICHKIDGLPLAIELVASRIRYMDAMTILDRLSERLDRIPSPDPGMIERHKTIEAAIEWSYNLLSEDEKVLFRRLSVFSGGFDLLAAEEVCADEHLTREKILDLLSQLVEKSMIQTVYTAARRMRYHLLETLQRYGSNQLILTGENDATSERHLAYFIKIAKDGYEQQFEAQSKWVDLFERERGNLLSALNWAESNSPEYFVELIGLLSWFWRLKADFSMGISYLERGLAYDVGSSDSKARNLFGLGLLTWQTGNSQRAVELFQRSLEIWRKLDIPREIASTLAEISEPLLHSGEPDASLKCSEEAVKIARDLGNPGLINHCLIYYCVVLVHTKHYHKGEPLVEELLASSTSLENIYGIETALHLHGDCAVGTGDFEEGEKRYAKGVEVSYKHGNLSLVAFDTQGVAFALSGQGRYAKAIRLDAAARELFKATGIEVDGMVGFWDEWIEIYLEGAKKKLGKERTKQCQEEGINMGFEKAVEYALDFNKD